MLNDVPGGVVKRDTPVTPYLKVAGVFVKVYLEVGIRYLALGFDLRGVLVSGRYIYHNECKRGRKGL